MSITIRGADGRLYSVSQASVQVSEETNTPVNSTNVLSVADSADRLSGGDVFGTGI